MATGPSQFKRTEETDRWNSLYQTSRKCGKPEKRWALFQKYAQKRAEARIKLCTSLVDSYKNRDILDIACGGGHYGLVVTQQGGKWTGCDMSMNMLRKGLNLLNRNDQIGFFIQGDITRLPFSRESFDVIFAVGILSYFPNNQVVEIVKQLPALLRPGGKLLMQTIRLDVLTWFRSRLPYWVPRPVRLLGPLYPRRANRIIRMFTNSSVQLVKVIEVRKIVLLPFQTIYLFQKNGRDMV